MYTPRSYREENREALFDLMRRYNFATLVTPVADSTHVTHLPFMIDAGRGPNGTLVAHMARANPHWRAFDEGRESLVIFVGAHAYISPAWYSNPVTVPTWNYAAVHAWGRPRAEHDTDRLRTMTMDLVEQHEAPIGRPWDPAHAGPVMDRELAAIVGFEMEIARLEGKFKFNQNKKPEDQEGVIRALEGSDDPLARETAEIIRKNLSKHPRD